MSAPTAPANAERDPGRPTRGAAASGSVPVGEVDTPARSAASNAGSVAFTFPLLLWVTVLAALLAIDLGGYLIAAARAQSLADAAALAAVSADVPTVVRPSPAAAAQRVAAEGDGRLEACTCRSGRETAEVTVSVAVPGLLLPTLGAGRVAAAATAILAPPDDLAPGPTRDRAEWTRPPDP